MKVSTWAEIRRLHEIEKLSKRAIAKQVRCSRRTIDRALALQEAPSTNRGVLPKKSILDPYKPKIDAIVKQYPDLSAVRILEKIAVSDGISPGYTGSISQLKSYLRTIRPIQGRVYQDITYSPGEAIQIDWGDVGSVAVNNTIRKVSVFVAVLCYSRMCYIEFTLSQRKCEFYRCLSNALKFYGGSPKKVIFDNLKAAVIHGSGRHATLHPEFLALCGHYCLEPIACRVRDPESKGMVESTVGYVKKNALKGRDDELKTWDDYGYLAIHWRDNIANVRLHHRFEEKPVDRFAIEKPILRPVPNVELNTDEIVISEVRPTARIEFDTNRYTVPPELARKTVTIQASTKHIRIFHQGALVACHDRCYGRRELIADSSHQLAALKLRRKQTASELEENFAALGAEAREFHLQLLKQPVRAIVHVRRIVELTRLYGRESVIASIRIALQYQTCDAAYVETILHQERRKQSLPSPTSVQPKRKDLIQLELDIPDPSIYDRFTKDED